MMRQIIVVIKKSLCRNNKSEGINTMAKPHEGLSKNKWCMLGHHNQTGPVHKHEIIRNSHTDVGILPTYSFFFQIVWHLCVMINGPRDVELFPKWSVSKFDCKMVYFPVEATTFHSDDGNCFNCSLLLGGKTHTFAIKYCYRSFCMQLNFPRSIYHVVPQAHGVYNVHRIWNLCPLYGSKIHNWSAAVATLPQQQCEHINSQQTGWSYLKKRCFPLPGIHRCIISRR